MERRQWPCCQDQTAIRGAQRAATARSICGPSLRLYECRVSRLRGGIVRCCPFERADEAHAFALLRPRRERPRDRADWIKMKNSTP